jgi:hypothetical protein
LQGLEGNSVKVEPSLPTAIGAYFLPFSARRQSVPECSRFQSQGYTLVNTDDPPDCSLPEWSVLRVEQIAILVRKLSDASILNTIESRARCRELATEMIHLLDDEDEYQGLVLLNVVPPPTEPLN